MTDAVWLNSGLDMIGERVGPLSGKLKVGCARYLMVLLTQVRGVLVSVDMLSENCADE